MGRNPLLGIFAQITQYIRLLTWYIFFKIMSIIFSMSVHDYYFTKKMTVYLLATKSHSGLKFSIMSVKPLKLCERARFMTGVNSLRFSGFSRHVTDTEDLAKKKAANF